MVEYEVGVWNVSSKLSQVVSASKQTISEQNAPLALVVLGMHRSGTSAITGALNICGAWVGEETELTGANIENIKGFWERRDMRQICDRLLHSAGADWWKISNFDLKSIPYSILKEEIGHFNKTIKSLNQHRIWAIKEPRLCILLPTLKIYVNRPICILISRNPLEVARSLNKRNGFSIAAGLALWEAYNLHALNAANNSSCILVSYQSLMQNPVGTLNKISDEINNLTGRCPLKVESKLIEQFIDPNLYHQRATDEETEAYLLPSQKQLWSKLKTGEVYDYMENKTTISLVTKQQLFDLESLELSLRWSNSEIDKLRITIRKKDKTNLKLTQENHKKSQEALYISQENRRLNQENSKLNQENSKLNSQIELERNKNHTPESSFSKLDEYATAIEELRNSNSWKLTAPLRILFKYIKQILKILIKSVSFFKQAILLAYRNIVPRSIHNKIPVKFRDFIRNKLIDSHTEREIKAEVRAAEIQFWNDNLSKSLASWRSFLNDFPEDEALSGRSKEMISVIERLLNLDNYQEEINHYHSLCNGRSKEQTKIVIYTAITGRYDSIKLPHNLDSRFDYVLFTDSPVPETGVWKIRPITYLRQDKTRSARFIKTHPHTLFSDFDIAIWIDSNIMILDDFYESVTKFLSTEMAVAAIPHPQRQSIYEESNVCVERKKDESFLISEQLKKYQNESFSHSDLIESNFMIFNLRHKKISIFLDSWWREIDCYSKRDQLSFNYALSKTGLDWYALTNKTHSMRDHPSFAFVPHDRGVGASMKLIEALKVPTSDPYKGPSYSEVKSQRINAQKEKSIVVVVCVHNALEDVRQCLDSILKSRISTNQRLIIIDDGSDKPTARYLESFTELVPWCECIRSNIPSGYTKAANRGLSASNGDLTILLNSDTVVTNGWAEKLSDALFSIPGAGIVGPLSNAASYQSIPDYRGTKGQTAINSLPDGLTPEDMNHHCEEWAHSHILPQDPLIHGFCFGIKREVIERIGYFDEKAFPRGYGEENDYCFRATDAGFSLAIATHTFVFHSKSKSYTDADRIALMESASKAFRAKHGQHRVKRATNSMAVNPILVDLRNRAEKLSSATQSKEL